METLAPSRPLASLQRLIEHANSLYSRHPDCPRPWGHVAKHLWSTLYERIPCALAPPHNDPAHQNGADPYKALEANLADFLTAHGLPPDDARWLAGPTVWFARSKNILDSRGTLNASAYEAARPDLPQAFSDYQKWLVQTLSDTFRTQR